MSDTGSIFLDFNLPNATTWFYFSALLAVALFFKFSRLLSMRNLDVLSLFLLVPGFLLLLEGGAKTWYGYLALLAGSGYFFLRCLFDLALVRRPALSPNLNLSGLAWLGGTLVVSLVAVAVRQPGEREVTKQQRPAPVDEAQRQAESFLGQVVESLGPLPREVGEADGFTKRAAVGRALAVLCHVAVVVGLVLIGWRHFGDVHAGMAAATFYLLLPYTYLLLPYTALRVGQWYHVLPAALVVWAVACYRLPTLAGLLLGLAAGTVYFPVVMLPLWVSFYWRRGAGRFAAAFLLGAGLCLGVIGGGLWMAGELPQSIRAALSDWQPWKELPPETTQGFWAQGLGAWAYRLPVFIGYVAFVVTTALWPSPKNLAHVLALTAAVVIGIQFWYADQGGVYVLWYLPLLVLLAFRPNLSDRRPLPIVPENDWLNRAGRALGRLVVRLLRPPQAVAGVR